MKIKKILFFGIVLVMFNAVYLAASLPDTVYVRSGTAKPGDTLSLTIGVAFRTDSPGGIIAAIKIDSTLTAKLDTAAGAWFSWDTSFAQKLIDNSAFPGTEGVTVDLQRGVLSVSIVGVNVKQLMTFGVITSRKGDLVHLKFHVAASAAEGNYAITEADAGSVLILPQPITNPALTDFPVLDAPPIMVANIPDYDALQMGAAMNAVIGDTILVPVKIENKDSVASGSFTVEYPSDMLTLGSPVTAGARGTGMAFTSAPGTALAATGSTMKVNVSFGGATVAPGGLGALCYIPFAVTGTSGSGSLNLSSVVLKGTAGTNLAGTIAPTTPASTLSFFYGDSLIVDLKAGDYSAINTSQRRVKLPIRLVNRKPVSVVRFWIQQDPSKPAGLLKIYQVNLTTRTTGWAVSVDTASGQVIATAPTLAQSIAAGNDVIFNISLAIMKPLLPAQLPIDVPMLLTGIEVYDNAGSAMGIQKVNGTVSLDDRVPNNGEGIDQGSSLPKAFALAQNSPNPFNPSTTIDYQIPEDAGAGVNFTLNVYDIRGSLIKILADGYKAPGAYKAFWDGTNNHGQQVSSGVYFYRFSSEKYNSTRKMILLK